MIAVYHLRHTVTAGEIDQLGHAGNIHYVRWMQDAAVSHSEALGWPLERFLVLGAGWVVRSHQVTYLRQALEREVIEVRTWVANMRRSTSLRKYEIRNAAGDLLAVPKPMTTAQRLIFAGTPDFSVPPLRALLDSQHEVVAVDHLIVRAVAEDSRDFRRWPAGDAVGGEDQRIRQLRTALGFKAENLRVSGVEDELRNTGSR
mgnify:CR=1 FL=1